MSKLGGAMTVPDEKLRGEFEAWGRTKPYLDHLMTPDENGRYPSWEGVAQPAWEAYQAGYQACKKQAAKLADGKYDDLLKLRQIAADNGHHEHRAQLDKAAKHVNDVASAIRRLGEGE